MNKKGSLTDLAYIAVVLVVFSMVVLIGLKIGEEVNNNLQADTTGMIDATTKANTDSAVTRFTYAIDNSFLFLMIFMCIGVLVLAAMVAVHPIFIPLYFFGWIFIIFLGGVFSNVYQEMAGNANLAGTASSLTFISYIMNFLPFVVGILGILIMIVMYKLGNNQ